MTPAGTLKVNMIDSGTPPTVVNPAKLNNKSDSNQSCAVAPSAWLRKATTKQYPSSARAANDS
jgi:hypothetical protein